MRKPVALAVLVFTAAASVAVVAAVLVHSDRPYTPSSTAIDASVDQIAVTYHVRLDEVPDGAPPWVADLARREGHRLFVVGSEAIPGAAAPFLVVTRESIIFNGEVIREMRRDEDSPVRAAVVGALTDWFSRSAEGGAERSELRVLFDRDVPASTRTAIAYSVERAHVRDAWFVARGADGYEAFEVHAGAP